MTPRITKVQRWLDLLVYLLGRRTPATVEEVFAHVPAYGGGDASPDSLRRKFERDKEELRRLGIPLETVSYTINFGAEQVEGYLLRERDFYLPYLRIVEEAAPEATGRGEVALAGEELATAADALHTVASIPAFPLADDARSALRKLTFDLAPEARTEPAIRVEPSATEPPRPDEVRLLTEALLARKRVRFRYAGIRRGTATDREVEPYGIFFQHGSWYLVAHDRGREDLRVFRVSRMEALEPNRTRPATPDYEVPADFDLADHTGRQPWELGDDDALEATVRFAFPASLWADRNGMGEPISEEAGGDAIRRFRVRQPAPFLRWVMGMAGEAEIVEPGELREAFAAMARETAALYAAE
jgi:proteasome accessory factor B